MDWVTRKVGNWEHWKEQGEVMNEKTQMGGGGVSIFCLQPSLTHESCLCGTYWLQPVREERSEQKLTLLQKKQFVAQAKLRKLDNQNEGNSIIRENNRIHSLQNQTDDAIQLYTIK